MRFGFHFSFPVLKVLNVSTSSRCRPSQNPSYHVATLRDDIQQYIQLSIASLTQQTYSAGEKRFIDFIQLYQPKGPRNPLPASEEVLIQFSAYLAKSIKHSFIKNYLAAVRHLHIRNGLKLDFNKMLRLQLVLRGIKRSQGESIRVRLPITVHHLTLFHIMLAIPTTTHFDSIMSWAAMTLAFFGFLRLGELTCNSKFNPEAHLKPDDVVFSSDQQLINAMFVKIKESKTDPFRTGHTITTGSSNTPLCPVLAMKKYLALRTTPSAGPLFVNSQGKPLTQDPAVAFSSRLPSLKFCMSQLSNWRCNYSSLG